MASEISRKIVDQIKLGKCRRNNCKSQGRDQLQIVWFGKQYNQKEATCSACFICNDQALKNAIPTQLNVLPLSLFIEQFVQEMKQYQSLKASKQFFPKVMKEKGKQFIADLTVSETEVIQILKQLASSLVNLTKKVQKATGNIFRHQIFEQLIVINTQAKFQGLLDKIGQLIVLLNFGVDEAYHFEDTQVRNKKISKLKNVITDISQKTVTSLKQLLESIKEKNELIGKL